MVKSKAKAAPWRNRVLRLERVRAGDLAGNPQNWRRHPPAQVEALKGVLSEVGFAGALLAYQEDGRLTLIDGHLRAGLDPEAEVPVLDVDREEARKLLATYDPLGAMAAPDQDALLALLRSVDSQSQAVKDMLEALANGSYAPLVPMPNIDLEVGLTDPDDVPEVPAESWVKRGDIFQLGQHRVMCGNSTVAEDVEKLRAGTKVDAIVTDPPYGINLDTDWTGIQGSLRAFAKRTRGHIYPQIIGDDKPFDPAPLFELWLASEMFLFGADYYAERVPNRNEGSWLVWDKRKESQADGIGSEFELLWSRKKHKRRVLRHEWFGILREGEYNERRIHPTQKSVALITDIIEQWCGDTIADPFLGSGTTLIACEKLGRKCMGMEISEGYVEIAIERWQNYTGRKAVKIDGNGHPG